MELTESYKRAVPEDLLRLYEFRETRNAAYLLKATNPQEFEAIVEILKGFRLLELDITGAGGNKSDVASRIDRAFREVGWREGRHALTISSVLTTMPYGAAGETTPTKIATEIRSDTYKVDNVKGRVAVDVEWNAKDGNLDRDLAAYRVLYDAGIIDGAVIITRTQEDLRALALVLNARTKFATTTSTNLPKLEQRMLRGDSGGCPVLAVAITSKLLQRAEEAPYAG